MTLRGQRLMCLEVAHMKYRCYDPFRHRLMPSRTSPRSYTASSPSTPSPVRQPNFTRPQAAAGKPNVNIQDIREFAKGGQKRRK
jgi:hypothetical protein